ncbi:MAG: quinone oxidoreductase [Planctomycetota bacterium]
MKAIVVEHTGGAEALQYQDHEDPRPGPGLGIVRIEAAGVNYIDTYHRSGLYPAECPFVLGVEGAGRLESVAENAFGLEAGQAVGFVGTMGAYAEKISVPTEKLIPLPEGTSAKTAAAALLQGMTAHYLTHATAPLEASDVVLVHAAAGGVGRLLCQMARRAGARVLGTVSSEEKAALARKAGADEVIRYDREPFDEAVRRLTKGRGVDVVYDSVGRSTFERSLDSLRPRGMMVTFGQSSGPIPPLELQVLNQKGSLFLTRPSLFHYVAERSELLERAGDVFQAIAASELDLHVDRELPLSEAAAAHRALESRETKGKVLLIP